MLVMRKILDANHGFFVFNENCTTFDVRKFETTATRPIDKKGENLCLMAQINRSLSGFLFCFQLHTKPSTPKRRNKKRIDI
jgi:hypothetical protein